MKEIKESINSVENSFILLLHEKCTFSIPKLNQIYSEIEELLERFTELIRNSHHLINSIEK